MIRFLWWLASTAVVVAAAFAAAFVLSLVLAFALFEILFFVALALIAVGLFAMSRGGSNRISYGDAGDPEEGASDAAELEREMRDIRGEGAGRSVLEHRIARLSLRGSALVAAGVVAIAMCFWFG
ncbi:hypothetical protein [Paenibacillus sp.]|uniref:hypothetical protein n=1 Tax=Paenibacillus sp. TaxID=58172 RepID=UPI002D35FB0E|nr:hypothetical protein [Paenibacillus sp.]HZG55636.1 hypothetical protein [Paenibacillus sp.]